MQFEIRSCERDLVTHAGVLEFIAEEGKCYVPHWTMTMLKLNDFNLADFPLWNDEHQQYCRYKNGRDGAIWRSPEEYKDEPRTEQIDVWALGSVFYVILTGLRPLYQKFPQKMPLFRQQIMNGESGYIDPRYATRSKAEAALVHAIQQCFIYDPDERASVFDIVHDLRGAVTDSLAEAQTTREAVLQDLSKND